MATYQKEFNVKNGLAVNGTVVIDATGTVAASSVQSGAFEPANANIQTHIGNTSNPHLVTYSQVGAEPANINIQNHISSTSNPHSVTATQVGLGNVTNESKATMFTNTTLTGTPTAPTPAIGNRSTQIATMEVFTNEFANSGTNSGYQKLPSGVIIQWGNVTATSMTFPIAFTSTPMVIHSSSTAGSYYWQSGGMEGVQSISTTGFVVWQASGSYIAIGR